jgi:site-specific DNA-methyltransferase (adenine-specific)
MDRVFQAEELNELHISSCTVLAGSCLDRLKELPDASIDAVVCDPPYELGLMSKKWDSSGIAFNTAVWSECLRVLKAGGHLVAFGGTRTVHRIACAIEDAGFEIRDTISWIYFSGFPKSLNISKAIDDLAGAEREIIGVSNGGLHRGSGHTVGSFTGQHAITAPATPEAQQWAGYGTALKPAQEPAILARKPIEAGSIARQVLATGTGAINIDACRFPFGDPCWVGDTDDTGERKPYKNPNAGYDNKGADFQKNTSAEIIYNYSPAGRWPANIYQCAKPSRSEKEQGLEHLEPSTGFDINGRDPDNIGHTYAHAGAGRTSSEIRNIHPTVKPLKLMRWLVRLVTPEGGTVLDPFAGSGTTLAAATLEDRHSIGVELTPEYLPIIHGRVQWARDEYYRENQQLVIPW